MAIQSRFRQWVNVDNNDKKNDCTRLALLLVQRDDPKLSELQIVWISTMIRILQDRIGIAW